MAKGVVDRLEAIKVDCEDRCRTVHAKAFLQPLAKAGAVQQSSERIVMSKMLETAFSLSALSDIMDLGTGGGFPGIPLAILFPDANFYLVDSINKKLNVANAVADAIDLKNITVSHTRAEDIHDKKFDIVVSRAVAPLKDLCHWSKPLLKKKPVNEPKKLTGLICLKGGDLNKEIAESGCRPHTWEIEKIFEEDFFKEKYILYVTG